MIFSVSCNPPLSQADTPSESLQITTMRIGGKTTAEPQVKKFFYYGTLKNTQHPDATQIQECTVQGFALWKWEFGWYPLGCPHKRGTLHGTLHDFSKMSDEQFKEYLNRVDSYEGYSPNNLKSSLYHRKLVTVKCPDGTTTQAWMYVFNYKPKWYQTMYRIPGGRWENKDKIKVRELKSEVKIE